MASSSMGSTGVKAAADRLHPLAAMQAQSQGHDQDPGKSTADIAWQHLRAHVDRQSIV